MVRAQLKPQTTSAPSKKPVRWYIQFQRRQRFSTPRDQRHCRTAASLQGRNGRLGTRKLHLFRPKQVLNPLRLATVKLKNLHRLVIIDTKYTFRAPKVSTLVVKDGLCLGRTNEGHAEKGVVPYRTKFEALLSVSVNSLCCRLQNPSFPS